MSTLNNFLLNLPLPLIDHWGYLLLFLSAMVEAMPIIGSFFPGHTIVFLGGFFANLGILRLDAAILVASVGAIAGDCLGYFIGRRYGHDFIVRYGKYFFVNQAKYESTRKLINEHAGKTIIAGRFYAFARAFTPFVAGISHVKFSKFIFYDIIGGVAWAGSSILIGYIFGQGFTTASKYFGRFIIIALIAIILIVLGYRFINKRRHIFAKFHVYYLTLNALSIYVFSKMLEDYFNKESTYRFDLWLAQNITSLWQPWLNKIMIVITNIFSPEVLLILAVLTGLYFIVKKYWYQAGLILAASGGGAIIAAIVKILVNRPRPTNSLVFETGMSFPSQHALMSLIFFSLLLFGGAKLIKNNWLKYLFIAANALIILLVGFSRIYLKVHWFSDVVAGYALGLFWLTLLILVFRIIKELYKKNNPD